MLETQFCTPILLVDSLAVCLGPGQKGIMHRGNLQKTKKKHEAHAQKPACTIPATEY